MQEAIDKIQKAIDEIRQNGEHHAEFVRSNGELVISGLEMALEILQNLPSAQPEIIRCKDCKYRGGLSGFYCDIVEKMVGVDNFCSWAERRTDG